MRILPVLSTSHVEKEKIRKSIAEALDMYTGSLSTGSTNQTYKTEVKIRNYTGIELSSGELISIAGAVVREKFQDWHVDLINPTVHIFINILKKVCCVSVVRDYQKCKKFNLQELQVQQHSVNADSGGRVDLKKLDDKNEAVELANDQSNSTAPSTTILPSPTLSTTSLLP